MEKLVKKSPTQGGKALELAMRDVLASLADSATYFAYRSTPDTLEILSIEAPRRHSFKAQAERHVTPIAQARSRDIVDFLIRRELHLERIAATA